MNAKERAIIEAIIDKSDIMRHDKALDILLFGAKRGAEDDLFKYEKIKGDSILSIPIVLQDRIRKTFEEVKFENAYLAFAKDFKLFLEETSAETLRDINVLKEWVFNQSEVFIKNKDNRKRIIERAIIESIIDKDDKRWHDKALTLLMFGKRTGGLSEKNVYVSCLEELVRNRIAKNVWFEDAYCTFASEFWKHLDELSPEILQNIDDLKSWLFVAARNFIDSNRKVIEVFKLGDSFLDESRVTDNNDDNNEGGCDDLCNDKEKENESKEDEETERLKHRQETESVEIVPFDEDDQDVLQRLDFARWRFLHYLGKLTNETYKDLLSAKYIEGVESETLAEEYHMEMPIFNLTMDHARNAFIAVALDDIQHCEPDLFRKYEYHEDMDDRTAALLRGFFVCKYDVQQLALLHHKTNYGMRMALAKAYKRLLRIHKNETESEETKIHQEERKQRRMKRLYELHKKLLKEKDDSSYWLLRRFYEDFKGDYAEMERHQLNNGANPDELERQFEVAYEVLDAIDKERKSIKMQN